MAFTDMGLLFMRSYALREGAVMEGKLWDGRFWMDG